MKITEQINNLGITKEEYTMYLEILKNPPTNLSQLAKDTNTHRVTMYQTLDSLVEKGLISKAVNYKSGAKYIASSPEKLLELAKAYQQKVNEEMFELENHVNFLKATTNEIDRDSQEIQILKGGTTNDELDKIMLKVGEPVTGFSYIYNVDTCFNINSDGELEANEYLDVVLKLTDKFVFPADEELVGRLKVFIEKNPFIKGKWLPRWIPKEKFDFNINFYCFGDNVAFGLGKYNEQDYLAYILKNREIARSMKSLVEYVWESATPIY